MPEKYIIDGYNVIFAGGPLEELARKSLEAARDQFVTRLEVFATEREVCLEVVFDAGRTGDPATSEKRGEFLTVTYTAPGQTADSYIEREAYVIRERKTGDVAVVTGDYLQQKMILGTGLLRVTPREFLADIGESMDRFKDDLSQRRRKPWMVKLERRISENERKALNRFRHKK